MKNGQIRIHRMKKCSVSIHFFSKTRKYSLANRLIQRATNKDEVFPIEYRNRLKCFEIEKVKEITFLEKYIEKKQN